jgi:hypothetical protein
MILGLACGVLALGCATTATPSADAEPGTEPDPQTPSGDPASDDNRVSVVLVNETQNVIDAQLYATSEPIDPDPEFLFVPEFALTDNVGVAGTGLLIPLSADTIQIDCAPDLLIGVNGGRFLDRDTGEELGTGSIRVVQQGLVFDCGATITFTYKESERQYSVIVDHSAE